MLASTPRGDEFLAPAQGRHESDIARTTHRRRSVGRATPAVRSRAQSGYRLTVNPRRAAKCSPVVSKMSGAGRMRWLTRSENGCSNKVTADPQRTPNFTFFANPDYFFASLANATPT
jgi:hypothetical protein